LSGLLRRVVRWLETNVSEGVLPPSSGLRFVIMEMYLLHPQGPLWVSNDAMKTSNYVRIK